MQRKRGTMSYGTAILGVGRIGGNYVRIAEQLPDSHAVVVAEPREEQTVELRRKYPHVNFVGDYKEAVNRDDIQIVICTLPHGMHKEAAIAAAEAGKHVYTEKPLATWAKDGEIMLKVAMQNGVKLMTAHTQRYYPVVKAAKKIVDSGRMGQLVMIHDIWHKPYSPYSRPAWMLDRELGGGMGQMDGTHQIDRTLWFGGYDTTSISAFVGQVTHPLSEHPTIKCDDTAMVFMRWKSGLVATLSRIAWEKGATEYGGDLFFTKGMLRFRIQYGKAGPKTALWVADTPSGKWEEEKVLHFDPLLEQFSDFVKALKNDTQDTPIPQKHGLHVLKVLEATEESARTGREVALDL